MNITTIIALLSMNVEPSLFLQERIQLETARLYKLAGINPLAGTVCCFRFSFVFPFETTFMVKLYFHFIC